MKRKKTLWEWLLNRFGWTLIHPQTTPPKSIICVAPHTSNWDFILGYLYYLSLQRPKPHFMIKREWFVFPLNLIFKALGGLPINRRKAGSTVEATVQEIAKRPRFHMAITPEGTRSPREHWKTGFYRIAHLANIPLEIAKIDYQKRELGIFATFTPTGDVEGDILQIRQFFSADMARYPENFVEVE